MTMPIAALVGDDGGIWRPRTCRRELRSYPDRRSRQRSLLPASQVESEPLDCCVDHAGVLRYGNERAGKSADVGGRHYAALLDRVVEHCQSRRRTVRSRSSQARSPRGYARRSRRQPGVGASERSTIPNGTPSLWDASVADELTHSCDLERGLL